MFGTIRKHQTWLWVLIIIVIIISFVFYFSPYSKMNQEVRKADLGSINGEKVSEGQYANAQREVYLRYFLMTGRWPDEEARRMGFDLERETYQWLLLQQKADQLGIQPSPATVEDQARQMIRPLEQMGVSSPSIFFQQVLAPNRLTAEDYERFVRNYIRIQELIATVGLSGKLVTPAEVKELYIRENQDLVTQAVFFSPSNYLSKVTVTPEAVSQFYSNRLANYRVPERLQVSFVKFPVSNFLAQAEQEIGTTNLNDLVEANVQRMGTNIARFGATPDAARAQIRLDLLKARALQETRRKAAEFASPLFDQQPMSAAALEEQAKKQGLPVQTTSPFTQEEGPQDLPVGPDFTKVAFSLTPEEPISRPLVGEDGVYVVALKNRIPSEVPPLDKVREQVTADYKHMQALNAARQAGMAFQQTVTNALAQGKSFEAVAKEANLQVANLPPFSLSTRSVPEVEEHLNINQLKQMAFGTPVGQATPFQPTMTGGAILFVKEKRPVDQAKMQASLPAYSQQVQRSRQQEAFNQWFRREAEKGLRDTPLNRPEPAPTPKLTTKPA
ncbi:MAG TPA: peptidyl-prolyl cis-trans isomerase [Clostridia bacterium]|nr:peptidyl-prolyl cis-trans isomerase [Clostridia bacterium]